MNEQLDTKMRNRIQSNTMTGSTSQQEGYHLEDSGLENNETSCMRQMPEPKLILWYSTFTRSKPCFRVTMRSDVTMVELTRETLGFRYPADMEKGRDIMVVGQSINMSAFFLVATWETFLVRADEEQIQVVKQYLKTVPVEAIESNTRLVTEV